MSIKYNWHNLLSRQRDALIAEHVFLTKVHYVNETTGCKVDYRGVTDLVNELVVSPTGVESSRLRHYSTDIGCSWDVVQKLTYRGYLFDIRTHKGIESFVPTYIATFFSEEEIAYYHNMSEFCSTSSEAICFAALRLVGVCV